MNRQAPGAVSNIMCILFLAINRHPQYPLIIAANRDEFYARPSSAMHYWPDQPQILAGRDDLKGGTWLGVTRQGRFCAVTNFRTGNPESEDALSRGELVRKYLAGKMDDPEYAGYLSENGHRYSPFNLVYGDVRKMQVYCNQDQSLARLDDGFHSLSNGYMDQHWPKMSLGVQKLTALVDQHCAINIDELNIIMHDQTRPHEDDLPDTGVGRDVESLISAIFINGADYGTRTTSYVLYSASGLEVIEQNYDQAGNITGQQAFNIPNDHG
jgi:uncharacterized protein with NRDE domain